MPDLPAKPRPIWEPSAAECVICRQGVHTSFIGYRDVDAGGFTIKEEERICLCFFCRSMRSLSKDGRVAEPC